MDDLDPKADQPVVVPVLAEELETGIRRVPTGGVRVHKHIENHQEIIDQPLRSEQVEVKRVVRNEVVPGPLPIRHEGATVIIPVVKEVLKVEKQFVLTEELHITKRAVQERHEETVVLRREQAKVERIDASGNPTGSAETIEPEDPAPVVDAKRKVAVRRNKILPNV